jgi:hypothetical protein
MTRSPVYRICSILAQIVIVVLTIAACSYVTIYGNFASVLNLLWLFGLPIGIAIFANKGVWARVIMSLVLVAFAALVFAEMLVATNCC